MLRSYFAFLHRWAGALFGLYIAMICLTGVLMVFQSDFYAWEFGDDVMAPTDFSRGHAAPDLWLKNAQEKYGPLHHIEGIFGPATTPMRIRVPTIIYEIDLASGGHGHGVVVIDPKTHQPKAHFIAEDTLAFWPLRLHNSLFFGDAFALVMMVSSVVLILFAVSGLYLWFQRPRVRMSDLLPGGIGSPPNLRKTHTALGIWLSVILIIFSLTGFGLARFDLAIQFANVTGRTEGIEIDPGAQRCEKPTYDNAWAKAERTFPNHEVVILFLPTENAPMYQIFLKPTGATFPTRGNTEIHLDTECLKTLYARSNNENQTGDILLSYLVDLHNGKILGQWGEAIVFVLGLAGGALPIAGLTAWAWRTRHQKKRQ